jgi:hypothetical protein
MIFNSTIFSTALPPNSSLPVQAQLPETLTATPLQCLQYAAAAKVYFPNLRTLKEIGSPTTTICTSSPCNTSCSSYGPRLRSAESGNTT